MASFSGLLSMLADTGATERAYSVGKLGTRVSQEEHQITQDALAIEREIKRIERENRKKGRRAGWGRLGGTIIGATLGGPVGAAAGSWAGSAIGGRGKLDVMDVPLSEGLFGKAKRQKLQDQLSEVESMVDEANTSRQQQYAMQAVSDALMTHMFMDEFGLEGKYEGKGGEWLQKKFPKLFPKSDVASAQSSGGLLGPDPGSALYGDINKLWVEGDINKARINAIMGQPLLQPTTQKDLPSFITEMFEEGPFRTAFSPLLNLLPTFKGE